MECYLGGPPVRRSSEDDGGGWRRQEVSDRKVEAGRRLTEGDVRRRREGGRGREGGEIGALVWGKIAPDRWPASDFLPKLETGQFRSQLETEKRKRSLSQSPKPNFVSNGDWSWMSVSKTEVNSTW